MSFLCILDTALFIVMLGFNGWNWYLAMTGFSTIEFFGVISQPDDGQKYDFNFKSVRDNMYRVFGTQSFLAIFSPSLRNVPFSGIEWSYHMKDLGFNEKGVLIREVIEEGRDEEEDSSQLQLHDEDDCEVTSTSKGQLKNRSQVADSSLDFLD